MANDQAWEAVPARAVDDGSDEGDSDINDARHEDQDEDNADYVAAVRAKGTARRPGLRPHRAPPCSRSTHATGDLTRCGRAAAGAGLAARAVKAEAETEAEAATVVAVAR